MENKIDIRPIQLEDYQAFNKAVTIAPDNRYVLDAINNMKNAQF